MSFTWIIFIPDQPGLVPEKERQHQAISYLREIVSRDSEIEVTVHDRIQFVHCGGNFESINCPSCGAEIDIGIWQDWMDTDYIEKGFVFSSHVMPCCGARHILNEIQYRFPQGFARFELSALYPDIGGLTDDQQIQIEEILGCRIRVIWRRI